jgi:hypothetical protein
VRKASAIIFLLLYLYNFIGYKAIFAYLEEKASNHLVSKIDRGQYRDDELIEVKVPYPSLYAPNWDDYARYDGEIELGGKHYNFVKRKFANDTLYLLCLPNAVNTRLASAKNKFSEAVAEAATSGKEKSKSGAANLLKSLSSDWNFFLNNYELNCPAALQDKCIAGSSSTLFDTFIPSFYKPPQARA